MKISDKIVWSLCPSSPWGIVIIKIENVTFLPFVRQKCLIFLPWDPQPGQPPRCTRSLHSLRTMHASPPYYTVAVDKCAGGREQDGGAVCRTPLIRHRPVSEHAPLFERKFDGPPLIVSITTGKCENLITRAIDDIKEHIFWWWWWRWWWRCRHNETAHS